jgi:hypothetical protein
MKQRIAEYVAEFKRVTERLQAGRKIAKIRKHRALCIQQLPPPGQIVLFSRYLDPLRDEVKNVPRITDGVEVRRAGMTAVQQRVDIRARLVVKAREYRVQYAIHRVPRSL